jgi:nucleotide-binding universal stress UspA family protein
MNAVAVPHRNPTHGDEVAENAGPIIAAVDGSAASRAAIDEAVRLGRDLDAPIVFAYARRGPAGFFGAPLYQERLSKEIARADSVLDRAVAAAAGAGVHAEGEILEGCPGRRIPEFARDRNARLVVVGARKRRLGRSVSNAVVRAAGRPVVVAKVARADSPAGGRSRARATQASETPTGREHEEER